MWERLLLQSRSHHHSEGVTKLAPDFGSLPPPAPPLPPPLMMMTVLEADQACTGTGMGTKSSRSLDHANRLCRGKRSPLCTRGLGYDVSLVLYR